MPSRRSLIIFISLGLLLLLGLWYRFHFQNKKLEVPAYMEEATTSTWKSYQPENKQFKILFPTDPQHISKNVPFENEQITYDVYSALGSDGSTYLLSIAHYPTTFDTTNTNFFEKLLQDIKKSSSNEVIGQTKTTFQDYPALDFDLQNIEFATLGRAVLFDKTLYVLTVTNPDRNQLEKNFHTFVNSLQISKGSSASSLQ